jgi:hypothetical protein
MQTEVNGGTRVFFKWNQIYKRFGPSRIFRWVFANNKVDLTQSVNALMAWPFRRVIVNHGTIFEGDGRRALHSEFSKFLNLRPLKKGDTP